MTIPDCFVFSLNIYLYFVCGPMNLAVQNLVKPTLLYLVESSWINLIVLILITWSRSPRWVSPENSRHFSSKCWLLKCINIILRSFLSFASMKRLHIQSLEHSGSASLLPHQSYPVHLSQPSSPPLCSSLPVVSLKYSSSYANYLTCYFKFSFSSQSFFSDYFFQPSCYVFKEKFLSYFLPSSCTIKIICSYISVVSLL